MRTVIFDVDGTLADNRHRQHYLDKRVKDWDGFFSQMHLDGVFSYVLEMYHALYSRYRIVICTGRPATYADATYKWFSDVAKLPGFHSVYFRKAGDLRPDHIVKLEMLNKIREDGHDVVFAIDDRPEVVTMWRENSVPCFQVDDSMWYRSVDSVVEDE